MCVWMLREKIALFIYFIYLFVYYLRLISKGKIIFDLPKEPYT